jgi:YfiH family protein
MAFSIDTRGVLRFEAWQAREWLVHGFSTRAAGDFRSSTAGESGAALGLPGPVVTAKQVHSAIVLQADGGIAAEEPRPEADGIVSSTAGETIGVRIADCLPLLLVDPVRKAVAAVHAGWRGSAAGIAAVAVERMTDCYGSRPEDLEALIGPCIAVGRYEVGEEVAGHFDARAVLRGQGRPRPHVDLAAANRLQLEEAGLSPANIHGGEHCSFSDAELFHSHRRDGEAAGRMIAFVGLR